MPADTIPGLAGTRRCAVLIADVLAATSNSDDTTFSIPILVAAAAVGVGWVVLLVAVAAWRRPHGIRSGASTQDLPPVPPAVAGLLCNDFELPAELPPATLLDLAARHEVQARGSRAGQDDLPRTGDGRERVDDPLRAAGTRRGPAQGGQRGRADRRGSTTGAEDASRGWHRAFSKEVIGDAQGRGLTRNRWPGWLVSLLGLGPFAVGGLLYLASVVGGESNDHPAAAGIAGGVAITAIGLIAVAAGRLSRSTAQLPTDAGRR